MLRKGRGAAIFGQSDHSLSGAFRAAAEEFEFVVEVDEAGFLANFFFEFMDRAGGIDGFDAVAVGADEVVAVLPRNQEGKIGGAFVETEAADHSFVAEALEEAEDGGFVTLMGEVAAGGEFGESHGPIVVGEAGEDGFERLGATESGRAGFLEEIVVERHG
ncbi:MAG: hypothetical protein ACJAT3_001689 [Akkermansiaceae bacterium]|jgi:hypothetical protein